MYNMYIEPYLVLEPSLEILKFEKKFKMGQNWKHNKV
jgi:hypothetical protein